MDLQDLFAQADAIDTDYDEYLTEEEEQYEKDIAEMMAEMADIPDDEIHKYI